MKPNYIIHIGIAKNKLNARCNISGKSYEELSKYDLLTALEEEKVLFGIDHAAIDALIEKVNQSKGKTVNETVLVANGRSPKEGHDAFIKIHVAEAEKVKINKDGSADYRNVRKFRTVASGQLLATKIPKVEGENGIGVDNQVLLAKKVNDIDLNHGENITYKPIEHQYYANIDGLFVHKNNRIDLLPNLEIPESINLKTGNVSFNGSISVKENIDKGAQVKVNGDALIKGSIFSSLVNVTGNLTVEHGIKTNEKTLIKVGGKILADHIENSAIQSWATVEIKTFSLNATIISNLDLIFHSAKSHLIGGRTIVYRNLTVHNIGNAHEAKTEIILGINYEDTKQYIAALRERDKSLSTYSKVLASGEKMKNTILRNKKNLNEETIKVIKENILAYQTILKEREDLNIKIENLKHSKDNHQTVELRVTGTIYPGTIIRYHGHNEIIRKPIKNSLIKYNNLHRQGEITSINEKDHK